MKYVKVHISREDNTDRAVCGRRAELRVSWQGFHKHLASDRCARCDMIASATRQLCNARPRYTGAELAALDRTCEECDAIERKIRF